MPSINMIAARAAERQRLAKRIRITALVIVAELAVVLFVFGFMTTRVFSAGQEMDRLDRELKAIEPTVQKIQMCEAEIKTLQPKLDLLADSREQTLLWYAVLQGLAKGMSQDTWLASLSTTTSVSSGTDKAKSTTILNLRGTSVSQSQVGETMLRLNQFPEFERVDLNYTQSNDSRARECVEFQIGVQLKPIKPDKADESEKSGGSKDAES